MLLPLALASCAAVGATPQRAFRQVAREVAPVVRVDAYAVVAGELRLEGRRIPPTVVDPGTVRALARHPAGPLLVAAERGLFTTAPGFDALDPLELPAPLEGALVGVVADEPERLWVATERVFACVEGRQRFARCFGPDDGAPPGPYRALARDRSGALLLATDDGVWAYLPDRGPPPDLRVRAAGGVSPDAQVVVPAAAGAAVPLEVEARARGGATLRWRPRYHHLWRELDPDAPAIEGLEPGAHELVVTAWDRDLRRSPDVPLRVDVAYPPALRTRRLVPLALAGAAAVLAGFLLRARRHGGGREALARALVSAVVAVALGLQLLVALVPHARSWPFVGFTMYTERYDEHDVTYKQELYVLAPDGARFQLEPFDSGFGLYEFRRFLAPAIQGDAATREELLRAFEERHGLPGLLGFDVLDERYRLTRDGPVRVAPIPLASYRRGAPGG